MRRFEWPGFSRCRANTSLNTLYGAPLNNQLCARQRLKQYPNWQLRRCSHPGEINFNKYHALPMIKREREKDLLLLSGLIIYFALSPQPKRLSRALCLVKNNAPRSARLNTHSKLFSRSSDKKESLLPRRSRRVRRRDYRLLFFSRVFCRTTLGHFFHFIYYDATRDERAAWHLLPLLKCVTALWVLFCTGRRLSKRWHWRAQMYAVVQICAL